MATQAIDADGVVFWIAVALFVWGGYCGYHEREEADRRPDLSVVPMAHIPSATPLAAFMTVEEWQAFESVTPKAYGEAILDGYFRGVFDMASLLKAVEVGLDNRCCRAYAPVIYLALSRFQDDPQRLAHTASLIVDEKDARDAPAALQLWLTQPQDIHPSALLASWGEIARPGGTPRKIPFPSELPHFQSKLAAPPAHCEVRP